MTAMIIYYDFCDISYSSFFLSGFINNAKEYNYQVKVTKNTPDLLCEKGMSEFKEILYSICLFKLKLMDKEFYFCIDTRDGCDTGKNNGVGFHLPLLEHVKYYFKVNYNENNIQNNSELCQYSNKIIPIYPFIPVKLKLQHLYRFMPRLLPCKTTGWALNKFFRRIYSLINTMSLEEVVSYRKNKKKLDIFFVVTYYHDKDIHDCENEFRYQIIKEIQRNTQIKAITGFTSKYPLPGKYADLRITPYPIRKYLKSISTSKIAIYVRGAHDCISFKFGQLLAMGMPITGQTIYNNKSLYGNDNFSYQFSSNEAKEIVKNAITLLNNPIKLKNLSESNAKVFDTKFTPEAVISDILKYLI